MKRNIFILLMCVGFLSCKDYLELNPLAATSTAQSFSNLTYATKSVLGVYRTMAGGNAYGIRLSLVYPYDNDEMWCFPRNQIPDNGARDVSRYGTTPAHPFLAPTFRALYTGVERANLCIKYIPLMDAYDNGTEEEQRQLRRLHGEALTLRALYYFELIRHWGDVPAQFIPSEDMADLNIPKTDRDEIYDRILEDLQTAIPMMPWRGEEGVGMDERLTQGAARGLRARIALFRGGYSLRRESNRMERRDDYHTYYAIARDECREVMQRTSAHRLNPSFLAVFKDAINAYQLEPNGEIMFEAAMIGNDYDLSSQLSYANGPRVAGNGNQSIIPIPTYFYAFDPADTRRDVTIANYRVLNDGTKEMMPLNELSDGKFRRDWLATNIPIITRLTYTDVNWPILRYSDILLMFAEAENELLGGPSAEAIDAFEQVRLRAFGGDASLIGATPGSYEGFFDAIVKERSLEFGGEGIRKYDLIRWNLLYAKLEEARANLVKMRNQEAPYDQLPRNIYYRKVGTELELYNSYYAPAPANPGDGHLTAGWVSWIDQRNLEWTAPNFLPNHSEVLPIPQTAIEANGNITQDFGY